MISGLYFRLQEILPSLTEDLQSLAKKGGSFECLELFSVSRYRYVNKPTWFVQLSYE